MLYSKLNKNKFNLLNRMNNFKKKEQKEIVSSIQENYFSKNK